MGSKASANNTVLGNTGDLGCREGGARYVGDTRLTVGQLLEALNDRGSADELLQQFPALEPQDIRDAVDYAGRQGLLN